MTVTRLQMRKEFEKQWATCMSSTFPGRGMAPAFARATSHLLDAASQKDRKLTRAYLRMYLNSGPFSSQKLSALSGSDRDPPLEAVRAALVNGKGITNEQKAALRTLLLAFRWELRVRPLLLMLTGLMRIERALAIMGRTPRQRALTLGTKTFFAQIKGEWQGKMFGASVAEFKDELRLAGNRGAYSKTTRHSLKVFLESVAESGNKSGTSSRVPLDKFRNGVYHADVSFTSTGTIEFSLSRSWVRHMKHGRTGKIGTVPYSQLLSNENKAEGLLCLVTATTSAAHLLAN